MGLYHPNRWYHAETDRCYHPTETDGTPTETDRTKCTLNLPQEIGSLMHKYPVPAPQKGVSLPNVATFK